MKCARDDCSISVDEDGSYCDKHSIIECCICMTSIPDISCDFCKNIFCVSCVGVLKKTTHRCPLCRENTFIDEQNRYVAGILDIPPLVFFGGDFSQIRIMV